MNSESSKRSRRSSEKVRALLLEAAQSLFAKGYDATTTKEICLKAGGSEGLFFSNFGSKAGLFKAAIAAPFSEITEKYMASWEGAPDSTPEERVEYFVRGLFDLAKKNRAALLSAVARRLVNGPEAEDDLLNQVGYILQTTEERSVPLRKAHGYRIDTPAAIIASGAMLLARIRDRRAEDQVAYCAPLLSKTTPGVRGERGERALGIWR